MAQRYRVNAITDNFHRWARDTAQQVNAFFREVGETTDTLTAGTTQTQAGATQLKVGTNRVTTSTANDGAKLPFADAGMECVIRNDGAGAIQVWPHTSGKVDSGAVDAVDSNTLAAGSARTYRAMSDTEWYTMGNS